MMRVCNLDTCPMGQAQQQAQNAGAQQGPQAGAKKDKDNVVDADYKVVDDDKK